MIELTDQQRQELGESSQPVRVVDPVTHREFVLVRAETFARLQAAFAESEPRDTYPAVDRAFAANWDDPNMSDYDDYERHRQ
jgi:hypothetical protein